jgi:hypothetical protein
MTHLGSIRHFVTGTRKSSHHEGGDVDIEDAEEGGSEDEDDACGTEF